MKNVEGFACGFTDAKHAFLFGKNVNLEAPMARRENLTSNGLTLFSNSQEARQALGQRSGFVVHLNFEIAETLVDLEKLRARRKVQFIVIMKNTGPLGNEWEFLGRQTSSKSERNAYPLSGAYTWQNRWKPFVSFRAADWAASEAARQARCYVTIAVFEIKRL